MFDNVVVGVDDYQAGRDALALATDLVSPDGKLLLVYVEVMALAPDPDADLEWQLAERRRGLERLVSVQHDGHVDAALLTVQARSVAAGLHEAARRHGDLLVIGASRRDEFERFYIDTDTRAVLKDSPCDVAVAPVGYATGARAVNKIGVAYDGSPRSEQALAVARALARDRHGELSAFEVVRDPMFVEDGVREARERIAALGDVEPHAALGVTAEELAAYAASVDLLVLGSHKHRPSDLVPGGTTSQRLADGVDCPLLVLSSASRAAQEAQAL